MEKIVKVGVGLYIFNSHHELLLGLRKSKHGRGTWCPPGGHLEYGENNAQAAVRETFEETGMKINPENVKIAGVTNDFFPESGKHYITLNLTVCGCEQTPRIMEPEKCAEWRWFNINELPEELFLPVKNFLAEHKLSELF